MNAWEQEQADLEKALRQYDGYEFSLRAFPGKRFKVSRADSYVSSGQVMLYTHIWIDDGDDRCPRGWNAFAKGSPDELKREITEMFGIQSYDGEAYHCPHGGGFERCCFGCGLSIAHQ
jgi:hypothetical protein